VVVAENLDLGCVVIERAATDKVGVSVPRQTRCVCMCVCACVCVRVCFFFYLGCVVIERAATGKLGLSSTSMDDGWDCSSLPVCALLVVGCSCVLCTAKNGVILGLHFQHTSAWASGTKGVNTPHTSHSWPTYVLCRQRMRV